MVGRPEHVRVAEQQRASVLRARDEADGRVQHVRARSLRPDERAGDVEPVLGQELVEVVAGHAAGDVGIFGADPVGDPVSEIAELLIDLAAPPSGRDDPLELLVGRRAYREARPVVQHDVELEHVVARLARHQRMRAARVVPEHAAERAVLVGRRIGAVGEVELLGRVAELVADHAGLDHGAPALGVEVDDLVVVLRVVEHDRHVRGLAARRRAAPAREDRRLVIPADRDRCDHVLRALGDHDADRHRPVDREVVRVHRARARVEANLSGDGLCQCTLEAGDVEVGRAGGDVAPLELGPAGDHRSPPVGGAGRYRISAARHQPDLA